MKYFISSSVKKELKDVVKLANELDCDIEISRFSNDLSNIDEIFESRIDGFKNDLKDFGGELNVHSFFIDLTAVTVDPLIKKVSHHRFEQTLYAAKKLGAKTVVYHTGFHENLKFSDYHKFFKEGYIAYWKDFVKDFEKADIVAVLENVQEKSPDFIFDVINAVDSPNLKASIDIGHINIHSDVPVVEWIKKYGDLLHHMHFHNNDTTDDSHCSLLGGTLDVEEILKTLGDLNLQPKMVLEIFKENDVRESLNYLKEVQSKLEKAKELQCR